MTYELAKKLKDAGFKFRGGVTFQESYKEYYGYWVCSNNCEEYFTGDDTAIDMKCKKCGGDMVWMGKPPTLSELIEACGDRFALSKNKDNWCAWIINSIPVGEHPYDKSYDMKSYGETPEEAVANLWLKLKNYDQKLYRLRNL